MHIVRKLTPNSPRTERSASADGNDNDNANVDREQRRQSAATSGDDGDDRTLSLLHLRKVYADFAKAPSLGSKEHDLKLRRMLPLLSKVILMYEPDELPSQFKEMPQFTGHFSRLFVQEIRTRASNQSTESDLEVAESSSLHKGGWQMLSGLSALVHSGHLATVETACRAALPSTLVKALYLFYDLPPLPQCDNDATDTVCLIRTQRSLLEEKFIDLLSRLCSHSCAGEELARKDDLMLLFSGASSWCPPQNVNWRKATAQLLMIISARILSQTVIKYIHSKGCVSQFLRNLKSTDGDAGDRSTEENERMTLTAAEKADMIVCLFCVLKDSANVTPVLLEDFKTADGYQFLVEFILECESLLLDTAETSTSVADALRNLLLMFSSAVTAGYVELRPTPPTSQLFSLPSFTLPLPLGHGRSVRNVDAFLVLERVFIKCKTESLASMVLDVISSIYSADPANYFILDQQCTLGQFAEIIHTKPKSVQMKFFELIEYVVFHLNYIPCKEFLTLCVVLKTQSCTECCILCVQSCFRILSYSQVLKDVFREVGLLEVLTSVAKQYATRVKNEGLDALPRQEKTLAFLSVDMLTMLVKGNSANARVFRECDGSGLILELIGRSVGDNGFSSLVEWRPSLLQLIQQLVMLPGGDEELSSLLALMHAPDASNQAEGYQQLPLKVAILKVLLCVLRESHRVRLLFRKVGGYLCLMSLLLNLEGVFNDNVNTDSDNIAPWIIARKAEAPVEFSLEILDFIQLLFKVLTMSMRFEPGNAKFFASEVRYDSLTVSLKLTGGFDDCNKLNVTDDDEESQFTIEDIRDQLRQLHLVFQTMLENRKLPGDIPLRLIASTYIIRLLYNMALDNYEKPCGDLATDADNVGLMNGNHNRTIFPSAVDTIVVHTGAVMSILELIPAIPYYSDPKWRLAARLYVAEVLKCVMRSERNQQVMCERGLPRRLFAVAKNVLRLGDRHPLGAPFFYVLERISAQAMQPKELRAFLRLDIPLCCRSLDSRSGEEQSALSTEGGPVPLNRVKALVSMMTPRDYRMAGLSISPPFIEFDMSVEGFGCVFLPSIAPIVGGPTSTVLSQSPSQSLDGGGGVGAGDRQFPPVGGLTFTCWLYVDRFSDPKKDAHPIRLLTITRTIPQTAVPDRLNRRSSTLSDWLSGDFGGSPRSVSTAGDSPASSSYYHSAASGEVVELACLTIQLSPLDRALLIGTHETDTPGADLDRDAGPSDSFARLSIDELRDEGQWTHLSIVLNRAMLKHSTLSVYVNGRLHSSQKLHYVVQSAGSGTGGGPVTGVHATIGTPPGPMRRQSQLLWRLGGSHLIEEALSADTLSQMVSLGPDYTGSFQCPSIVDKQSNVGSPTLPMVAEEKVSFGIHASALSLMTLSKLKKVYNKADSKAIAKYLGISTSENATPIRVLHNSAGHLNGPARSLGGVVIGYLGMRAFWAHPVSCLLRSIGGVSCLLGLTAMANDSDGLYAALKSLLCALRNNRTTRLHFDNARGFQTLAVLLKEKNRLLNSHILHLVFSLVGTLDSSRETTVIPDVQAFEDLLCDLDVWAAASGDLQRLLYEHFYELITESGEQKENLKIVRQAGLLSRLLFRLGGEPNLLEPTKDIVFNLIAAILQPVPDTNSLLKFGQFIASTLPVVKSDQQPEEASIPFELTEIQSLLFASSSDSLNMPVYNVYVRNRCLNILTNSLLHTSGNLNAQLCEQVVRVLGFDWVLTLLGGQCHQGTVYLALRVLLSLCASSLAAATVSSHSSSQQNSLPPLLTRFRDGTGNAGWLTDAESVVQNSAGTLLGFSVSAHGGSVGSACDINPELCRCPGFHSLAHLLPHHAHSADACLALVSLLVGRPAKLLHHVPSGEFTLDSIWSLLFNLTPNGSVADAIVGVQLCADALTPLTAIMRVCFAKYDSGCTEEWCRRHPQTILQFFTFLYHNVADFASFCSQEESLVALMSILFSSPPLSSLSTDIVEDETIDDDTVLISTTSNSKGVMPPLSASSMHPCRRGVIELLKTILVDNFHTGQPTAKGVSPIDVLLEMMPEGDGGRREQCQFATDLLTSVMEHLLAADVLLSGGNAPSSQSGTAMMFVASSSYSSLASNVFYFSSRLVDCVWNGLFVADGQMVFDFVVKLLSQSKRRPGSGVPADALVHSLNRITLYLLSRPIDSAAAQLHMTESLHRVTANRGVVLAATNGDAEFNCCLAHLLFMSSVKPDFLPATPASAEEESPEDYQQKRFHEGSKLVVNAACRLWEELYLAKKQVLEDKLRTALVPEITAARALVGEAASQYWQHFVDGEIRGPSRDLSQIHQQLQSKIQKVASGLQRLTSRKSVIGTPSSATTISNRNTGVSPQVLHMWMRVHISLIRELFRLQSSRYHQWHEHVQKWCLDEWHSVEQELIRERGLWGPDRGSVLDKWRLDSTEGPCRVRKKMIPYPQFYTFYPYRPNLEAPEAKSLKGKVAISKDSRTYYERLKQRRPRTLDARIVDLSVTVSTPSEDRSFLFRDLNEIHASMIRRVSLSKQPSQVKQRSDTVAGDEEEDAEAAEKRSASNADGVSSPSFAADTAQQPSKKKKVRKRVRFGASPKEGTPGGDGNGRVDGTPTSIAATPVSRSLQHSNSTVQHQQQQTLLSKGPDNQTLLRLLEEGEELNSMFRSARIQGLDTNEGLLLFGKSHYYVVDGYTLLKTREIRDLDFLPEELHDPIVPYQAVGCGGRPPNQKRQCSRFAYEDIREVHKRRYLLQPIALEVFVSDGRNYLLAFPKKMRNRIYSKFVSVAKTLTDGGAQSVSGQRSSMNLEQSGRSSLFSSLIGEQSVTQRWARGELSNFQYLMHLNTLAGRSYNDLSQYPVFPWILSDYESEELDLTDPKSFRDLSKPMGALHADRLEQFMKRYREWDDPTGETPPYMFGTHYSSAMIVVSYLVRIEPFTQQFLKLQGGHFDLADRMFHSIKDAWLSASKNNMADVKELIPEFFYLPDFLCNDNNFDLGVKQSGVPLHDVVLPPWSKSDPREFIRLHREALESDYVSSRLHEWIDLVFGYKQLGEDAIEAKNLFHHLFYEGNVDFEAIEDPLTRNATIGFINNFGQIPSQLFKKPHPQKKLASSASTKAGLTPLTDPLLPTAGVTTDRYFFHALDCLKPPTAPTKELKGGVGQLLQTEKGILCGVEQNKVLLPPLYTRYVAWGFADRSIRLGTYETEKSYCIHELTEWGEITCGFSPNNRTLVTGGTDTVVSVWELVNVSSKAGSSLCLRRSLYGHTEPVSCLDASNEYGIVVSGSRDTTCIVWDLSNLQFIRQLQPHSGPVSAVAINNATGDVASASGAYLFLWTLNGQLLASVNTSSSPLMDNKQLILCLGFSTINEWDPMHVVITGSNDGVVRLWSCEFVQTEASTSGASDGAADWGEMARQASLDTPQSAPPSSKSLRYFAPEVLQERLMRQNKRYADGISKSLETPAETPSYWSQNGSPEAVSPCPNDMDSGLGTPFHNRSMSFGSMTAANSAQSSATAPSTAISSGTSIQTSSCTPLAKQGSTDSLVFVNRDGLTIMKTPKRLRPGYRWQRQLVFRSKLTLHTAFERKDNVAPAAITSVAPSRDHKSLLVGDSRGRIWTWTVGGEGSGATAGGRADHWVQDLSRSTCSQCQQRFTIAERKHHCRNCGQIFCARCSRFESEIRHMKIARPVRVCQSCFLRLKAETT